MNPQLRSFQHSAQTGQELSRETIADCTITLGDDPTPIACSGGVIAESTPQLLIGGLLPATTVSFRVRKTLLSALPAIGTLLTYKGEQWRISASRDVPNDIVFNITAESPEK